MKTQNQHSVLVDAHVHLHRNFDPETFLEAGRDNVSRFHRVFDPHRPATGILLIVDGAGDDGFNRLKNFGLGPGLRSNGPWTFSRSDEEESLVVTSVQGETLIVIAGSQIQTSDGLEVLTIGGRHSAPYSGPIEEVIRNLTTDGNLAIVPWGFGKWSGRRGRIIQNLVKDDSLPPFFLADNGNRPTWWPEPAYFAMASERGIPNTPGSDPLPMRNEVSRVGSYGFVLQGPVDVTQPARWLADRLAKRPFVHTYGSRVGLGRFCVSQVTMQFIKRTRRRPAPE